ncbi:subtilisin-like protein [Anaeromyces robustus]|uniref:Subtilisin-like protein n=1 Tax=Anaeromyces robustus TaxID=1754192 RepID=A0A1Y1X0W8_9FUNG|nr:subtilisin-like protein [Anaeromyces robustus]|eukprot:ORX79056.1 subtilisin-like protein [Anaeromyces robustus]
MKSLSFAFMVVVLFNYFINALADNDHYIITLKTKINHNDYDDDQNVKDAVDVFVNDKLNDMYDIIEENKDTYTLENGQMDEKLEELDSIVMNKRHHRSTKLLFINEVNPQNITAIQNFQNLQNLQKRSDNSTEILDDKVEYIPVESKLVSPICPLDSGYAVVIYASDEVIKKVKKLPDIKRCNKSIPSENHANTYYNLDYIQKETNWTNVRVQDRFKNVSRNFYSHLSLVSQSHFDPENTEVYDNTYYYPKTAGQDIDIYFIEETGYFHYDEFDTYNGSRTVTCDAISDTNDGFTELSYDDERRVKGCGVSDRDSSIHGTIVSMTAGGKYTGAAKKANLHIIATSLYTHTELKSLEYIRLHARPNKTIVNISRGGRGYVPEIQEIFTELSRNGVIIFVSGGNEHENCDSNRFRYGGFDDVITVGATEDTIDRDISNGYTFSSYSNYGKCIDIFAPGEVFYPSVGGFYLFEKDGTDYFRDYGTSYATPLVAGIAATIMSEHREIRYNYNLMKKTLIDMSLKDILYGLPDKTVNRFVNNGKRVVLSPNNAYHGCGENSGNYKCSKGCCSKDNKCIEFDGSSVSQSCLVSMGCQSEYSEFCLSNKSTSTSIRLVNNRCGPGYGSCIIKSSRYIDSVGCCSKDGYCGTSSQHCGKGCQSEFGACYSSN